MINLLICGISGRLGQKIYKSAKAGGINVVCGVDLNICNCCDCPVYRDFDEVKENVDIIIDFSSSQALDGVLNFAIANRCALVEGTTGFTSEQKNKIFLASKNIPIFLSDNMSLGINLLLKAANIFTVNYPDAAIEITEKHRLLKKDSPSGTALMLKAGIKKAQENHPPVREIQIHSLRGGNIPGDHEIIFMINDEVISISHRALSPDLFAESAIKVSCFLLGKPNGLYNMDDYFNR